MTMHDERWTIGVAENGDVRLRDAKTGETLRFGGSRGLFDALGKLADWRERMPDHNRDYGALHPDDRAEARRRDERARTDNTQKSHYGAACGDNNTHGAHDGCEGIRWRFDPETSGRSAIPEPHHKSDYGASFAHPVGSHLGGCPDRDWTGEPYPFCELARPDTDNTQKSHYGVPAVDVICSCGHSLGVHGVNGCAQADVGHEDQLVHCACGKTDDQIIRRGAHHKSDHGVPARVGADPLTGVPLCGHGDDADACQLMHRKSDSGT